LGRGPRPSFALIWSELGIAVQLSKKYLNGGNKSRRALNFTHEEEQHPKKTPAINANMQVRL
jgi:hypothetical protein